MHNFVNLKIWQTGMDLAQSIYEITERLPQHEIFGLISQMQRAATSIPSNIAEGAGRNTNKEFSHFLSIAIGSCFEIHTQIILSERIGYISKIQSESLQEILNILQPQIVSFKKRLDRNPENETF